VRRADQCPKLGDLMLAKAFDDAGAGRITQLRLLARRRRE